MGIPSIMAPQALPLPNLFWVTVITLILLATLASMIAAWTWAIGRLRAGQPLLPEPEARPIPWGTGSVLIVFVAWLAVNIVVSIAYLRMSGSWPKPDHKPPSFTEQMAVVSISNGLLLAIIPPILRLSSRASLADLGVERRDLARNILAGSVGFLLIAPLVYLLNGLAVLVWQPHKHPLEQMVTSEPTAAIACLAFLSAVVLAPAAEELIFRGIIQNWLGQSLRRPTSDQGPVAAVDPSPITDALDPSPSIDAGGSIGRDEAAGEAEGGGDGGVITATNSTTPTPLPGRSDADFNPYAPPIAASTIPTTRPPRSRWRGGRRRGFSPRRASSLAIVITSAVFAAVHLPQWPAPLAIFFLSLGLGVVFQRTGSLIASFLMHALFNGLSTMMLFQAVLMGHPAAPGTTPEASRTSTLDDSSAQGGPSQVAPSIRPVVKH